MNLFKKKPILVSVNPVKCHGYAVPINSETGQVKSLEGEILSEKNNALIRNFSDGSVDVMCPRAKAIDTFSNKVTKYECSVASEQRILQYKYKCTGHNRCFYSRAPV